MSKISICIPVWEQHGVGLSHLKDLICSIFLQSFKDWEIIISDHSKNDDICDYITECDANIKYVRTLTNYGNGVHNLNQSLQRASGEIIKIMFQDDLMYSDKCLEYIYDSFQIPTNEWVVCGCNHTLDGINFDKTLVPYWNDDILYGVNTISSPSVLAFRNKDIEFFDENLTMLMDVEYYYRLYKRFGHPHIINDTLISNRQHPNQISNRYDKNINDEIEYVKQKYDSN
jgi:glycosyltransferase involved in cell wall biosynthesis